QVKCARGAVGQTDGESMMRRLREPKRLGLRLGRLGESAELGEALDQPGAIIDRWRCGDSEILRDPVGREYRQVVGGKLVRSFVLAPTVMRHLEIGRGEDAEPQVPERPGDLQPAVTGYKRLVQLAEHRVCARHERADTASPVIVVQPFSEGLGLAQ